MANEITNDNFKQIVIDNDTVVVDLWAEWCGPCKALTPIIEKVATSMTDVFIGKVNVDENPEIASEYKIRSIPTLLFFKSGKLVLTHIGMIPETQLIEKINTVKNG